MTWHVGGRLVSVQRLFPGPANTGLTGVGIDPSTLTPESGTINITTSNQVIEGIYLTGQVRVDPNNAGITGTVFRNCRFKQTSTYAINCNYNGGNGASHAPITIEDCDFVIDAPSFPAGSTPPSAFINLGNNCTILRNSFSGGVVALQSISAGTLIQDNYSFGLSEYFDAGGAGSHNENLYVNPPGGAAHAPIIVSHNTLLNPLTQTACIFLNGQNGNIGYVTIDNNLLAGGGYCIYGGSQGGGIPSFVTITNNVISKRYFAAGGNSGWRVDASLTNGCSIGGNTYDDGTPAT